MSAKRVAELQPGDMVDGETLGDYLCRDHDCPDAVVAEFEYFVVDWVEPETDFCTLVVFENADGYGLPPNLIVQVS